ncbi:MAG: gamma-glutamylcyclotransferase [Opitutaceae bacterium]|nr:gamma-glutamylcyclotransferase [Opitutaceae bacterium]
MKAESIIQYFAYGSNLKLSEMCGTCPSAVRLFRAMLPRHALVFPRKSLIRHCGVAGVETSAVNSVWGGVYAIPEEEQSLLEAREGYRPGRPLSENSYFPQEVTVYEDGDMQKPHRVLTFVANRQPNTPLPSLEYRNLIVSGAKEWKLGANYLAILENIQIAT